MDLGSGPKSIGNLHYARASHHSSFRSVTDSILELWGGMRKTKMRAGGHLGFGLGFKIHREPPLY